MKYADLSEVVLAWRRLREQVRQCGAQAINYQSFKDEARSISERPTPLSQDPPAVYWLDTLWALDRLLRELATKVGVRRFSVWGLHRLEAMPVCQVLEHPLCPRVARGTAYAMVRSTDDALSRLVTERGWWITEEEWWLK